MKKPIFLLMILVTLSTLSFGKTNDVKTFEDYLVLQSGEVYKGEIVKFGTNSFKIEDESGKISEIKNIDVNLVALGQDLTAIEKYNLGVLDGKRYAQNKGGNLALGFFTGIIGTGIVYLTSDQVPSPSAQLGPNKLIVNDPDYSRGYSKGAKSKSGGNALIGTIIWIGLLLIA